MMKMRLATAMILPAMLLLQACSTRDGYPSLAIRDSERVSMSMAAPDTPLFIPAPAQQSTIESLDQLTANAIAANERFLAATGGVEASVGRAAGSAIGSEEWAVAQVEIAGLESLRSDTMFALAEIDQVFVNAVVDGEQYDAAEQKRDEVAQLVAQQDRLLSALLATLGS